MQQGTLGPLLNGKSLPMTPRKSIFEIPKNELYASKLTLKKKALDVLDGGETPEKMTRSIIYKLNRPCGKSIEAEPIRNSSLEQMKRVSSIEADVSKVL